MRKGIEKKLKEIIAEATQQLTISYINMPECCGWRNGLENTAGVFPGPTATALGLDFFSSSEFIPALIKKDHIINYLLTSQLVDSKGNRTGWEVMSMKKNNTFYMRSMDTVTVLFSTMYKTKNNTVSVPSIDATATVINVLNKIMQDDCSAVNMRLDIDQAIQAGKEWLIHMLESGIWGVHENDTNRIFVMCNVLHAVIPLVGKNDKRIMKVVQFILGAQKKHGGWDATKSKGNAEDIYHTAKVLNLLAMFYHTGSNQLDSKIEKGIQYLKNQIKHLDKLENKCYIEEDVRDCENNTKTFYHSTYSEWMKFICDYSNQWSEDEFRMVLDKFLSVHLAGDEKFYNIEDGNKEKKKQVWILLPAAVQSRQILQYIKVRKKTFIMNRMILRYLVCSALSLILLGVVILLGGKNWMANCAIPLALNLVYDLLKLLQKYSSKGK